MLWYGRWVTSYKNGDKVLFIDKCDKTLKKGILLLPEEHFTSNWLICDEDISYKNDVQMVCPDNVWYDTNRDRILSDFKEHKDKSNGN